LLINLVFFLFLFSVLAHNLTMAGAGNLFLDRVEKSYLFVGHEIMRGWAWARGAWQNQRL